MWKIYTVDYIAIERGEHEYPVHEVFNTLDNAKAYIRGLKGRGWKFKPYKTNGLWDIHEWHLGRGGMFWQMGVWRYGANHDWKEFSWRKEIERSRRDIARYVRNVLAHDEAFVPVEGRDFGG